MKKSNVTLITAILIGIHLLVFAYFMGTRHGKGYQPEAATAPVAQPAAPIQPEPEAQPEPVVAPPPVQRVATPAAAPLESIATPVSRAGYLRPDRPGQRTSKVYEKLVGNPYQGAIVLDANTGKILFENRAGAYAYPASVTKLMTMLIVLEQIDAGAIHRDDKVTITKDAVGVGGSQAYLDTRESGYFTVEDLLKALTVHSANDAARALGIHVAGSKQGFVDLMNKKARELGMNSTTYHSEHGLPPEDGTQPDISTAYDIAILSLACLRHPDTLRYSGIKLDYLPLTPLRKERFMLANRNALVDIYPGCDGLKTGYHGMGGWSLAATAEQNGRRIVSVVLGCPDKNTRNATSRELLDKGFKILAAEGR